MNTTDVYYSNNIPCCKEICSLQFLLVSTSFTILYYFEERKGTQFARILLLSVQPMRPRVPRKGLVHWGASDAGYFSLVLNDDHNEATPALVVRYMEIK